MSEKTDSAPKLWHIIIPAVTTLLVAIIGLGTAIYQTEKPIRLTEVALTEQAARQTTAAPTLAAKTNAPPTKTELPQAATPAASFTITNHLNLPVKIMLDSINKGEVGAGGVKTFLMDSFPVILKWSVVKETTSAGKPLGNEMGGSIANVERGDKVIIDNVVDGQLFFYPIITNATTTDCEVTINQGWKSEYVTHALVSANDTNIGFGYYELYTNSNVSLTCGNDSYWWGLRPDEKDGVSFFDDVEAETGIVEFTLKP